MSDANEVPISSHIMGRLDDILTDLKPLKRSEKIEIHFLTILWITESFKTMNRPDLAQPDPAQSDPTVTLFDGLFLGKY